MLLAVLFFGAISSIGTLIGTVIGAGLYVVVMVVSAALIFTVGLAGLTAYHSIRRAIDRRNPDLY